MSKFFAIAHYASYIIILIVQQNYFQAYLVKLFRQNRSFRVAKELLNCASTGFRCWYVYYARTIQTILLHGTLSKYSTSLFHEKHLT